MNFVWENNKSWDGTKTWVQKNTLNLSKNWIYVNLPHHKSLDYTGCGVSACYVLGKYYNVGPDSYKEWKKLLDHNVNCGVDPDSIIKNFSTLGVCCFGQKLTLNKLLNYVKKGFPVLCPIQAYGSYYNYKTLWSGHYVVVIGFSEKYLFFEDSYVSKKRTYFSKSKFLNRWKDIDWLCRTYHNYGIVFKQNSNYNKFYKRAIKLW